MSPALITYSPQIHHTTLAKIRSEFIVHNYYINYYYYHMTLFSKCTKNTKGHSWLDLNPGLKCCSPLDPLDPDYQLVRGYNWHYNSHGIITCPCIETIKNDMSWSHLQNNLLTLGFCVEPHQQDDGPQLSTWHHQEDSYDLFRGHISKRT